MQKRIGWFVYEELHDIMERWIASSGPGCLKGG